MYGSPRMDGLAVCSKQPAREPPEVNIYMHACLQPCCSSTYLTVGIKCMGVSRWTRNQQQLKPWHTPPSTLAARQACSCVLLQGSMEQAGKRRHYSTRGSQVLPQPSTSRAQPRLTSEF
jgi:hypothetical protein